MDEKNKNISDIPAIEDFFKDEEEITVPDASLQRRAQNKPRTLSSKEKPAAPQQKKAPAAANTSNRAPEKRRPPVRYDENGRPIPPKRPPVRYDENGRPIPPKRRPIRYDENGKPIPPSQRIPARYDENGKPIRPKAPQAKTPAASTSNSRSMTSQNKTVTGTGYARYQENKEDIFDRDAYMKEQGKGKQEKQENAKKKRNVFGIILIILQALFSAVFMTCILVLDMLPTKYVIAIAAVLVVLWVFTMVSQKFKAGRIVGKIYAILISIILILGSVYIWKTHTVIDEITTEPAMRVSDVSIVVMNDSPAKGLQDLAGQIIGVQSQVDRENTDSTIEDLNNLLSTPAMTAEYPDVMEAVDALYAGSVNAILINEVYRDIILDVYPKFDAETRVLNTFTYETQVIHREERPEVKVDEEPFTVFISGNDAYGTVSLADGRSDVNILITVNPTTKQVLMTTTPRDYYVELPFYSGCMDKLTHASIYGVDTSIVTLENLYGIEIDYYIRINFSGFERIVDALDGIEVYSDYSFTSTIGGFYFNQGYNYLYGETALAFSRERYAFSDGDFQRGRNQMKVISAIIDKILSPSILMNYLSLMDSLSGSFITDMPRDKIADLVKMQLDDGAEWNIVSNTVLGTGTMRTTYSGGRQSLSVVIPDSYQVQQAADLIHAVENEEIISQP